MNESRVDRIGSLRPILLLIALLFGACGGSSSVSNSDSSASPAPPPTPKASPLTSFEEALRYVRNGQYTYIWVFSRKDGKPLDKDDGAFLRTNAPQIVDWVRADDEGRKVIGGTNFNLEEGNLDALKKRFVTEDYSAR
jgi:hypothetical protein